MANRIGLKPQILRPAAAPRDTFVMPNAGAGLGQLADALSQVNPALSRFGSIVAQEKGEKDKLEGENRAREFVTAQKTYKEAIEAGLIQKNQSPFYRIGAMETFGRASAHRYWEDFTVNFAASEAAQSTDPADFDKWEGEYRTKWMQEKLGESVDPFMESSFGKQVDTLINGERGNFAHNAAQRLEGQIAESFQAEVFSIAKLGYEGHADPENVLEHIQLAMDRQIAGHMPKRIVNENVAEAIVAAAKRMNDISVLDLMDKIRVGSGFLSGVTKFAQLREDAENQIASVNQAKLEQEARKAEREREAAVDAVTGEFTDALLADPTVNVEPFIARAKAAGDSSKAVTYINMQKAFVDREYMDVPEVKQRLLIGVHTGYTSMNRLDDALASKSITFQTYSQLAEEVSQRNKEGRDRGDEKLTTGMERVRRRTVGLFVAEFGDSSEEQRRRAENAGAEAVVNWLEWRKTPEGQKAGPVEQEQWIHAEATRQFGLKSDKAEDIVDADIPPAIFGGPKRVNPEKAPAVERPIYQQMREDLVKLERGQRPSAATIRVMKQFNIPADPKALKQFLDAQAKFLGN
jgi:hypothetical protein